MKRSFVLAGLFLAFGGGLYAQTAAPVDTTVCDVIKQPASFNGKIVRIKGTVVAGFDEFIIKDASSSTCNFQVNGIWLSYPAGTKGKAGPVVMVQLQPAHNFTGDLKAPARTPVTLDKSKDFKQFDSLLSQSHQKGADMCLGCMRYEVSATLVGRLDGVDNAHLKRDPKGHILAFSGFGNLNSYPARLVLQSVSDVTPKEVDYTKSDAITKGEAPMAFPQDGAPYADPFTDVQKLAASLEASAAGNAARDAANAFPKPKEKNGVIVSYGVNNEADKNEAQGVEDSPDGILYNCSFNKEHLQGNALKWAIFHVGAHVSNLRNPRPGNEDAPVSILENDAWVVTSVPAIVTRQKFLTLPGGYQFWNINLPATERDNKMVESLKEFLTNEALLGQ